MQFSSVSLYFYTMKTNDEFKTPFLFYRVTELYRMLFISLMSLISVIFFFSFLFVLSRVLLLYSPFCGLCTLIFLYLASAAGIPI